MGLTLREMSAEDYAPVRALWESTDGVGLSGADSREGVERFLERNPGLSCVALVDDAIAGAVLCGHDGRRGYIEHLAVHPEKRGRGIGRAPIERCLAGLQAARIQKCHILVYADNRAGQAFWSHIDWLERIELRVMSRDVAPPEGVRSTGR